jgi:hypothetical protein
MEHELLQCLLEVRTDGFVYDPPPDVGVRFVVTLCRRVDVDAAQQSRFFLVEQRVVE